MKFHENKLFKSPVGLKYLYSLQGLVEFNSDGYIYTEHVDWSPDGKYLAIAKTNQIVEIWDINLEKTAHTIHTNLKSIAISNRGGTVSFIAWSPDGKYLATLTDMSNIEVWDIATLKREWTFNSNFCNNYTIRDFSWCPNGKFLAFSSEDENVWILNAQDGKLITKLEGHKNEVNCIA